MVVLVFYSTIVEMEVQRRSKDAEAGVAQVCAIMLAMAGSRQPDKYGGVHLRWPVTHSGWLGSIITPVT